VLVAPCSIGKLAWMVAQRFSQHLSDVFVLRRLHLWVVVMTDFAHSSGALTQECYYHCACSFMLNWRAFIVALRFSWHICDV
jgi:hypothetical protein